MPRRDDAGQDASPFRPARRPGGMERFVPVTGGLRGYRPHTGGRDLIAAATVAAVAIPAAMGYAEVAGLSPINGLYALLLPTLAYAVLGSSRQLVVGPDGSISALVGALVIGSTASQSQAAEVAATLALLVAACFAVAWVVRLAWLADYLSQPVLVGYLHGIVIVLIIGQLPKLLGIDVSATQPLKELSETVTELGDTSLATLAVGACALAVLLPLRFLVPRFPAALLVVVAGIAISSAIGLADDGVAVVGAIPSGLPHITLPSPSASKTVELLPTALGLFFVIFADAIITARMFAGRHGQHVDARQELLAIGAANAAAGISQGYPPGASNSRTAVNDAAGVRTQVAGVLSAVIVGLVLLLFTAQLSDLPKAVLGAVIVSAAIGLVDLGAWRRIAETDNVELAIAGVTTAGVVIAGVLPAIAFAAGLSVVDVVRRSAQPHDAVLGWVPELGRYADVAVHHAAQRTDGVVAYRVDDRIFFANASYVKARMREAVHGSPTEVRWVVLDAEAVGHIDAAGLDALRDLAREFAADGVTLVFARLKTPMWRRFEEAGLVAEVGADHFYPTVRAAVEAFAPQGDFTPTG